jgi:hypothetical protein
MSQYGPAFAPEFPTFVASAAAIASANNKSMLALAVANVAGAPTLKVRAIWLVNAQNTAVTGINGVFELRRITSVAGGTVVAPLPYDTADTIAASVTCVTNGTVAGEATGLLRRAVWSTDEWGPGALDVESNDHAEQVLLPMWTKQPNQKALTIRPGEGLTLKFATNSTTGSFDIFIEFTQE